MYFCQGNRSRKLIFTPKMSGWEDTDLKDFATSLHPAAGVGEEEEKEEEGVGAKVVLTSTASILSTLNAPN